MRVFNNLDDINGIKNPVVTTGSFDGVHVGHTMIINRINRLAREIDGESVLITFFPHPRKVLYPESSGKGLKLINSHREKIDLLERTGLDNLVIINFTLAFSKTTSDEFVEKILVEKIGAKKVVIGFNHHFGKNREGDFEKLYQQGKRFGFTVEEIPEQDLQNETVSSTKIRDALQKGDIQKANAYLGHRYLISGELRRINPAEGYRQMEWYGITIEEDCKLVPPPGLYAVCTFYKGQQYKGMAEINQNNEKILGCNHNKNVIVHFFEMGKSLHGRITTILFAKRIGDVPDKKDVKKQQSKLLSTRNQIKELIY